MKRADHAATLRLDVGQIQKLAVRLDRRDRLAPEDQAPGAAAADRDLMAGAIARARVQLDALEAANHA